MKTLDSDIRETLQAAAEAAPPSGYYDELAERVAAKLEVHGMRGVDMSGANGSGDRTQPPPQAVGGTVGRTTAKNDDSGLIDIKNMARSTRRRVTARHSTQSEAEESLLASARPSALRDVVLPEPGKEQPASLAAAAEAVEPEEQQERKGGSSWMLAVAAVVLIGGGAAAFFATRGGGQDETRVAANEAPAATAVAPAGIGAGDEAPPAEPAIPGAAVAQDDSDDTDDNDGDGASDDGADDTATGDAPATDDGSGSDDGKRGSAAKVAKADRDSKRDSAERKVAEPSKAGPETKDSADKVARADKTDKTDKAEPPKGQDLDSLLDFAAGEEGRKKSDDTAVAEKKKVPASKTRLSRAEVQDGMRSVTARVAACYERFKQPGTVKLKVTISNTGVVTQATATGPFANTDTGACVAKAVSQATFPEFSGTPMSLTYPFLLQ